MCGAVTISPTLLLRRARAAVLRDGDLNAAAAPGFGRALAPLHLRFRRSGRVRRSTARPIPVERSCVLFSVATTVEAAFRASGIKVRQLSWQYIGEMIREDAQDRIFEALCVVKYHGIMMHDDFKRGIVNARRYKIHQFYQMGNPENVAITPQITLDKHIIKAALDNFLKKSVLIGRIPISLNYYDLEDGEHIYYFDGRGTPRLE
uniref:Uncharacterized protein n=1 Tax=Oryza meridionalis TaxID=40149 RepID=A0A0E0F8C1_9ORYZ